MVLHIDFKDGTSQEYDYGYVEVAHEYNGYYYVVIGKCEIKWPIYEVALVDVRQ